MYDTFFVVLSTLPLIIVNIWHSILLFSRERDNKPHTISHHAAETTNLLRVHRIMHISASVILMLFSFCYLFLHNHYLVGWLLIGGALFDVLEVITLNKKSAEKVVSVNYHTITAWTMAFFYLVYASLISLTVNFSSLLVFAIWIAFVVFLIISVARSFKSFWIMQHIYFCFLALIMIAAHLSFLHS